MADTNPRRREETAACFRIQFTKACYPGAMAETSIVESARNEFVDATCGATRLRITGTPDRAGPTVNATEAQETGPRTFTQVSA